MFLDVVDVLGCQLILMESDRAEGSCSSSRFLLLLLFVFLETKGVSLGTDTFKSSSKVPPTRCRLENSAPMDGSQPAPIPFSVVVLTLVLNMLLDAIISAAGKVVINNSLLFSIVFIFILTLFLIKLCQNIDLQYTRVRSLSHYIYHMRSEHNSTG